MNEYVCAEPSAFFSGRQELFGIQAACGLGRVMVSLGAGIFLCVFLSSCQSQNVDMAPQDPNLGGQIVYEAKDPQTQRVMFQFFVDEHTDGTYSKPVARFCDAADNVWQVTFFTEHPKTWVVHKVSPEQGITIVNIDKVGRAFFDEPLFRVPLDSIVDHLIMDR